MSKKISDLLPETEILAQLAEEASELAQAALKLRRALDGTNPTPKSVKECESSFMEEIADIEVCVDAFFDSLNMECKEEREWWDKEDEIEKSKSARWLSRLEERERKKDE